MKKKIISVFTIFALIMPVIAVAEELNDLSTEAPMVEITITDENNNFIETNFFDNMGSEEGINTTEEPLNENNTILQNNDENSLNLMNIEDESVGWSYQTALKQTNANGHTLNINGRLYMIGGENTNGVVQMISAYNQDSNSWNKVVNIDNVPQGYAVAEKDKSIYIIGGYKDGKFLNSVRKYDLNTNLWSDCIPMKNRRDQASALVLNNKLYVFGGRDSKGIVNSYEYYDFTNNTWNEVTSGYDSSFIRIGASAYDLDGYICMAGGYNSEFNQCGVDAYESNDLNVKETVSSNYDDIKIAQGQGKALVFMRNYNSTETVVKEVSNNEGLIVNTVTLGTMPAQLYSSFIINSGYLYCMGGYTPSTKTYSDQMYKYSIFYGDFAHGDGDITNVVTENGNSITLNVEAGKEYLLFINVKNISSLTGKVFTIEYADGAFKIVDGCAITENKDTGIGTIENANVEILSKETNGLSFISSLPIPSGKAVTSCVNAIRIKAEGSGERQIVYRMTQE